MVADHFAEHTLQRSHEAFTGAVGCWIENSSGDVWNVQAAEHGCEGTFILCALVGGPFLGCRISGQPCIIYCRCNCGGRMVCDDGELGDFSEVVDNDDDPGLVVLFWGRGYGRSASFAVGCCMSLIGRVWDIKGATGVHEDVLERSIKVEGLWVFY